MTLVLLSRQLDHGHGGPTPCSKATAKPGGMAPRHHGCGLTFVVLHMNEWLHLINEEHVTPFDNLGACRYSAARSSPSPACI